MSSPIQGLGMGMYDASYLTAVQREIAHSVKTNSLKDLDDDVAAALLLTTDEVNLSPEAKAYLQQLRAKRRKKRADEDELDYSKPDERDFSSLLQGLANFRDSAVEEESEQQKPKLENKAVFPREIQLSSYVPGAKRPPTSVYSPVRETIDRMIYYAPSQEARKRLQDELEPLGFEIVSGVKSFGVKCIVIPRNAALTDIRINNIMIVHPSERTFDGRPWSIVRGLYDNSRRLFVIGEEQLGNPAHSTARHEFAHAFDNAFSETHRRRLPLSVQLWNLFRKDRTGMVSAYASTNPAEYFAESVDAFFLPQKRDQLKRDDPKMFAYLNELFALG